MIRLTDPEDAAAIRELYTRAAATRYGLLRDPEEVDEHYAVTISEVNRRGGLGLGYFDGERLRGEVHAHHCTRVRAHSHLLTGTGIAVDPETSGRGIGRLLFTEFLDRVSRERPDIYRVELYAFARNERNVRFYASLGFREEGRYPGKNLQPDGTLETPISMAWINPGCKLPGSIRR